MSIRVNWTKFPDDDYAYSSRDILCDFVDGYCSFGALITASSNPNTKRELKKLRQLGSTKTKERAKRAIKRYGWQNE